MESPPDPRVGTQLAEYRIEGLIGRGGMGVVYLAEHVHLGKRVALKVLPPEYAADQDFRERFEREARLAASLEHPNIVPVTDAGEFDGELWIAMRFVDGTDLREVLNAHGALNPIRAVSILGRVGSALDAAHASGLIHRDVKPGNILLEPPSPTRQVEHVYLTDFGLTKQVDVSQDDVAGQFAASDIHKGVADHGLTKVGYFAGTVDYAAPEQFRGERLDGRVDVYALGCVLYECLAGRPPYVGDDEQQVMAMHMQAPIPKASALHPGIPIGMDAVIKRAMAKDRDRRFPNCKQLMEAARSFLAGWDPSRDTGVRVPGAQAGVPSGSPSGAPSAVPSGSFPAAPSGSIPGPPPPPSGSWPSSPGGPGPAASHPPPTGPTMPSPAPSGPTHPPASGPNPPTHSTPSAPGAPPVFPAPAAPSTTSFRPRPARRPGLFARNPLLAWVLAGAAAALVVVIVVVVLAR
jgi:serine/threonine protein kinase